MTLDFSFHTRPLLAVVLSLTIFSDLFSQRATAKEAGRMTSKNISKNDFDTVKKISYEAGLKKLLKKNAKILQNKAALLAFEGIKDKADYALIPQIRILSYIAPTYEVTGDSLRVTRNFNKWGYLIHNEMQIIWPFFAFGKISLNQKAAKQGLRAYQNLQKSNINQKIFEYKKLYLSLILAKQLKSVLAEAQSRLDEILEQANKIYASGTGKILRKDIARLKIYNIELKKLHEELKSNQKTGFAAMGYFFGERKNYDTINEELPELREDILPLKKLIEISFKKNPDIKAVSLGVNARKNLLAVEEKSLFPIFFIAARGNANYSDVTQDQDSSFAYDPYNNFDIGIAGGFNWEFNWGGYKSKVKKARSEYEKILARQKEAYTGYPFEISKAFWEMEKNKMLWRLSQKKLKEAQKWSVAEFTSYSSGFGDVKDLVESLALYYLVKREIIDSEYNYLVSWANICLKVGESAMLKKWS